MDGTLASIEGYPLSPQQARLWSLARSAQRPLRSWIALELRGADDARVDAAVAASVARHEILRTAFVALPGMAQPLQSVAAVGAPVRLASADLPASQDHVAVLEALSCHTEASDAPPLRYATRPAPGGLQLFLGVHALCADAAGLDVLAEEIATACTSAYAEAAEPAELLQYADLSYWLNERLRDDARSDARAAWQRFRAPLPARLPEERDEKSSARVETLRVALEPERVGQVASLATRLGVGEEAVFLAAWQLLLLRLCAQDAVRIRVACDGRGRPELAGTIGPLCRWLPLDARLDLDARFEQAVLAASRALDETATWQDYFDPALHVDEASSAFGFRFRDRRGRIAHIVASRSPVEDFKLTLSLTLEAGDCSAELSWQAQALPEAFGTRLAGFWHTLLAEALVHPERAAGHLELLDAGTRGQLLSEFNATDCARTRAGDAFHRCFERQARLTPQRPAARDDSGQIDYETLNARANRLARELRRAGAATDVAIGLCLPRSIDLVVALLAVAKAGAAYVPLDPELPAERLDYMIRDTAMPVVITRRSYVARLAAAPAVIAIDEPSPSPDLSDADLEGIHDPAALAYILYTSGSTGRPKGVQIEHRQLANYLHWAIAAYRVGEGSGAPVHTAVGFDATITSLLPPLMTGGCLELIAEGREIESLARILRDAQRYCLFKLTPAHLEALSHVVGDEVLPGAPGCFVVGGEVLAGDTVAAWHRRAPNTRLINEYGPTETVVGCSIHEVERDATYPASVPIGCPIANTRIYVLDARGQLVPPGVAGEIHIGGAGVARGYLNLAEQTRERFLPDPFSPVAGARMYRSGDLGRWRNDGVLEFLGRADEQIKLRGHRIEPDEIEACLRSCPGVEEAAVACDVEPGGAARLVAFFRASEPRPGADLLQQQLARVLPAYMVPSAIVAVDALPLTVNGKVDRKALLKCHRHRANTRAAFAPPQSNEEILLAQLWSEVLRVEPIGLADGFFELGGDSIRAIQLRARLQQRGWDLPLQQVMDGTTLAGMAAQIRRADAAPAAASVPFALLGAADRARLPAGLADAYPASQLQLGMLFHSAYRGGSQLYVDVDSLHVRAPLQVEAMRAALQAAIDRHPVLRTSFALSGYGQPMQLVHAEITVPFEVEDWRGMSEAEQELRLQAWLDGQRDQGFDPLRPGLLRVCVAFRSEDSFQFGLSRHHAILDGWSAATLMTELVRDYGGRIGAFPASPVDEPRSTFRDFVAQESALLTGGEAKAYWHERLRGAGSITLPRNGEPDREVGAPGGADKLRLEVPVELATALGDIAREQRTSLKNVLLAAHVRVLALLGNTRDVLTGLVVNGRLEEADGERALGLFLNTVPFRVGLPGGSWRELVREVSRAELELLPFRRYPFARIQSATGLQLDILFNFVHFHVYEGVASLPGFELLGTRSSEQTSFALLLNASQDPRSGALALELHFDTGTLDRDQVQRIAGYYRTVLQMLASEPDARYEQTLPLLDARERETLLHTFNATVADYPQDALIQGLFEAQVSRTPGAIAVQHADEVLTYAQLNARANRLARHLRARGVGAGQLVGICLDRGADLIVSLLAVLKSGAAYLPLDPAYPRERIGFMLGDARAPLVIAHRRWLPLLADTVPACCLEEEAAAIAQQAPDDLAPAQGARDLAYVIYTSGSTGVPKGVAIEHRSAVALLHWARDTFTPAQRAGMLVSTSICFDLSVFEIFLPLSWGDRAIVVENVLQLPATAGVTLVNTVPSAIAELVRGGPLPATVQAVALAGEPLQNVLAQAVYAAGAQAVFNLYGPSEDTTYSTWARVARGSNEAVCIGRPVANTRAYVLDAQRQLVPLGVAGELYLGGDGLARGYLHRPELTAERFVADPFGAPGERLYRTGDLVRYRHDGQLEFLGRIDHQVKIRGYRIELGEIEAALLEQPGVAEAIVVTCEDGQGGKRLVAYTGGAQTPDPVALRAQLRACLPEYMVPALFVHLAALPQTPNGKIDRAALPAPGVQRATISRAPASATEQQIAALWRELLGVDAVGAEDNFFDLGGHSLLAMQMHARLRECLGRGHDLELVDVFSHPSIASLAARIDAGGQAASLNEAAQRADRRRAAMNDNRRKQTRNSRA